jgi:hypothetical protein
MDENVSDAVLAMAEIPAEEPKETEVPQEVETEGKTEETTEDKVESEETPEVETKEDTKGIDPQNAAMLAKAEDVTKKWQAEQSRADSLQKQLDEMNQKPAPDPIDDPAGFQQHQTDQMTAERETRSKERLEDRMEMSRMLVMSVKEDYEDIEKVFLAEAQENPVLARKLSEAPNPAMFAYEQGLRIQMLSADPETLREQIRQEERAKILKEQETTDTEKAAKQAEIDNAISPSLATKGNSGLDTETPADMDFIKQATGEDATHRK